jgi:acyl-coenzyme A synthetase/AMP-(fatty) acid ligase
MHRFADRTYVIEASTGRSYTYEDVLSGSLRLAERLMGHGVRSGDFVLVCAGNTPEFVFIGFALLWIRATMVPLDESIRQSAFAYIQGQSGAKWVIRGRSPTRAFDEIAELSVDADELIAGPKPALALDAPAGDTPLVLLYTSGTTGKPKGALLPVASQLADNITFGERMGFDESTCYLQVLPTHHADGWGFTLIIPFLSGSTVVLTAPFDLSVCAKLEKYIEQYGANVLVGMPSIFSAVVAWGAKYRAPAKAGLRFALTSSEPLSGQVRTNFEQLFGAEVLEFYGTTEAGLIAYDSPGVHRPGSVGRLQELVRLKKKDGRIWVFTPYLFGGYLGESSVPHDEEGFFDTGDVGSIDADGYLFIGGRQDDVMTRNGVKIVPAEIDERVRELEQVRDCFTLLVQDPVLGAQVVTFVVAAEGRTGEEATALVLAIEQHCARQLDPEKRPKVHPISVLPLTSVGKVDREALRRTFTQGAM